MGIDILDRLFHCHDTILLPQKMLHLSYIAVIHVSANLFSYYIIIVFVVNSHSEEDFTAMAAFFGANEIWKSYDGEGREPVILVGVRETDVKVPVPEEEFSHSLEELAELAGACGMEAVDTVTQTLSHINTGLYVGAGKADEIRICAEMFGAERVIFNDTLSPSQIRNLQKLLKLPVMDRTALILEIFERRARTREARLQVELAKLRYLKPRLIGMWETQNRQGGASGSMSAKGEGETQLEIDRRTIDHRLSELTKELKGVSRERATQRKKRQGSGIPLVSLVGYTNAGKSTIMNSMLAQYSLDAVPEGETDKRQVFEADMLFATLDTTVRRITVARGQEFLLSDTVGFIHKLPTSLVEAFKSTLEEVTQADLLVQVVDGSDPHCRKHIEVTKRIINEIGAGHIPMITVYNKADLCDPPAAHPVKGAVEQTVDGVNNVNLYLCAKENSSIECLCREIFDILHAKRSVRTFLIPYDRGSIVSFLMDRAVILQTEYTAEGTKITAECEASTAEQVEKMLK